MPPSLRGLWTRTRLRSNQDLIERWAREAGGLCKRMRPDPADSPRDSDGFVIEWPAPLTPSRIEWGPAMRHYIGGAELRLRGDVEVPVELQALVMDKALADRLEAEVYAQATGGVQTRLDDATPQEMRWLAMLTSLRPESLGALGPLYAAASNAPDWLRVWLGGELGARLMAADAGGPAPLPWVMMINQGRMSMRMGMPVVDVAAVARQHALFGCAAAAVHPANAQVFEADDPGTPL